MPANASPLPRSYWVGASLTMGLLGLGLVIGYLQSFRSAATPLPVLGQVADFTLTNQAGQVTSLAAFTNHVWLADIIFTRCAGPCPRMTQQMGQVQAGLPASSPAKLVTLTTDPEFDTPEQLTRYGRHFGADFNRWTFLTGEKLQVGLLAANSLKLASEPIKLADQKDAADLFIHTTIFVAVDKHARLRAIFQT
ncbi:MAG TPA: SCO family protein, partial [Verrucomicrobiae bacterium]